MESRLDEAAIWRARGLVRHARKIWPRTRMSWHTLTPADPHPAAPVAGLIDAASRRGWNITHLFRSSGGERGTP